MAFNLLTAQWNGRSYEFRREEGSLDLDWDNPTDDEIRGAVAMAVSAAESGELPDLSGMKIGRHETVINLYPPATFGS